MGPNPAKLTQINPKGKPAQKNLLGGLKADGFYYFLALTGGTPPRTPPYSCFTYFGCDRGRLFQRFLLFF